MKSILAVAAAALALAACEPVHHVERMNTCAFAGIQNVDHASCATRGSGVYNVAKTPAVVVWHNPHETDSMHVHETMPKEHWIHGKVHMEGCPHGGTKAHYHKGKLYHRVCAK